MTLEMQSRCAVRCALRRYARAFAAGLLMWVCMPAMAQAEEQGAQLSAGDERAAHLIQLKERNARFRRASLVTLASTGAGILAGLTLAAGMCYVETQSSSDAWCILPIFIGGPFGFASGVIATTMALGYLLDGEGTVAATLLGLVAGVFAGGTLLYGGAFGLVAFSSAMAAFYDARPVLTPLSFVYAALLYVVAGLMPAAGAALGYELSSPVSRTRTPGSRGGFAPFVMRGGGGLMFAWTF